MLVAHNLYAQNAQRQYNITTSNKRKSTEKLSSGYKINRAADDAAGLQISEKMRKQIRGLNRGTENMQDGVSWLQIGDGAMNEVHSILQRMNELSVQGANGTLSKSDREAIDAEVQQLKTEIDRINETTKFNEMRIFTQDEPVPDDNGEVIVKKLDKMPDDLKIFNATYDDATGEATYGGIVFHGDRITWDKLGADVYMDGGTQKFHEGTWVYVDSQNRMLTISAKEGDEVPSITRTFDINAGSDGLYIDGEVVPWKNITNKSGESVSDSKYVNGTWYVNYHGATLTLEVVNSFNGLSGMIAAINREHDENLFNVYAKYVGSSEVQAVDADLNLKNVRVSNSVAQMLAAGKSYVIRADEDGIWLQDGDGNDVAGSKKTWSSMGISSWDSGSDINESITYRYSDTDGSNDTYIAFEYELSDITSVDSVIDGLDGIAINSSNVVSNYGIALVENGLHSNVTNVALTHSDTPSVSLREEIDLGRDFGQQTQDFDGSLTYDSKNDAVSLSYANNGTDVITYVGSASGIRTSMEGALEAYEASILSSKILQALWGVSGDLNLGSKRLESLLGADKITTTGKMSEKVTVTDAIEWEYTDGSNNSQYKITPGKECCTAVIDFSGLGTDYNIWELVGSGFDSTCAGCKKHYSVKFVFDTEGGSEINGFRYKIDESNGKVYGSVSTDYNNNPVLEISVSSLVEKGTQTGSELASAIVTITDQGFDQHYQQYAAKGNQLYVLDNRYYMSGGTFYTTSYGAEPPVVEGTYALNLSSPSKGSQTLTYGYNFTNYRDRIKVELVKDPDGEYVMDAATGVYVKYDSTVPATEQLYSIRVSYGNDTTGTPNDSQTETRELTVEGSPVTVKTVGDASKARGTYVSDAISEMTGAGTLALQAQDYTRVDYSGNENPNMAVDSLFEAFSTELPARSNREHMKGQGSIQIQKSGDTKNKLIIPRFSLNGVALGIEKMNCLTQGDCRNAIDMVGRALARVSTRRSLYGALQNRLEHAIASNDNTEENTTASESGIRDTDMAEEMVNYSKQSILEQVGQSMLAQANLQHQSVLSLLQ